MDEIYTIDESNFDDDVLRQAIISYKEVMRRPTHDLDVQYFIKTLKAVNSLSPVKVACNPITEDRKWNVDAALYNVSKIEVDEEHHLTVHIRKDKTEYSAEKALDEIGKLKRKLHGMMGPVMLDLPNSDKIQLTDVYSHSLVKDAWAGLPFDVVLGYFVKEKGNEKAQDGETPEE